MATDELLGREAELALIGAFLERSTPGPKALVIEGEPGIGKTTLWREAIRLEESRGTRVLSCRAAEAEAKLSFSALVDADLCQLAAERTGRRDLPPVTAHAIVFLALFVNHPISSLGLESPPPRLALADLRWEEKGSR